MTGNTLFVKLELYFSAQTLQMSDQKNLMNFHTRKWVKPEDLNPNSTLFGGRLLQWIDEEAALYAVIQLENPHVVTQFISEINFI